MSCMDVMVGGVLSIGSAYVAIVIGLDVAVEWW